MRISNLVCYALTASATIPMLFGCGGSSQIAPSPLARFSAGNQYVQGPTVQGGRLNGFLASHGGMGPARGSAGPSFMDPLAVGKPLLFVSDNANGDVTIYLQGGKNKIVGQIAGPIGFDLAADSAGNLYSANLAFSSNSVTVYAPPYTNGPKLTLTGRFSGAVAVSRKGTVAVPACTISSGTKCGLGVLFYAAGKSVPCATVLVDASAFPNGVFGAAFDHKGNLYVDSAGSGTQAPLAVGKIDGGCNAKKAKTLTTANTIPYAGTLRVDKAGRIAILAVAGASPYTVAIYTYDPPKSGSLGSPVSTTPLPGALDNSSGTFAFQASGRGLWAGYDDVGPSYTPGASEFGYPAGGAPKRTVLGTPSAVTYGVAVTPALVP